MSACGKEASPIRFCQMCVCVCVCVCVLVWYSDTLVCVETMFVRQLSDARILLDTKTGLFNIVNMVIHSNSLVMSLVDF